VGQAVPPNTACFSPWACDRVNAREQIQQRREKILRGAALF
jgi:hypothetical protein